MLNIVQNGVTLQNLTSKTSFPLSNVDINKSIDKMIIPGCNVLQHNMKTNLDPSGGFSSKNHIQTACEFPRCLNTASGRFGNAMASNNYAHRYIYMQEYGLEK